MSEYQPIEKCTIEAWRKLFGLSICCCASACNHFGAPFERNKMNKKKKKYKNNKKKFAAHKNATLLHFLCTPSLLSHTLTHCWLARLARLYSFIRHFIGLRLLNISLNDVSYTILSLLLVVIIIILIILLLLYINIVIDITLN